MIKPHVYYRRFISLNIHCLTILNNQKERREFQEVKQDLSDKILELELRIDQSEKRQQFERRQRFVSLVLCFQARLQFEYISI